MSNFIWKQNKPSLLSELEICHFMLEMRSLLCVQPSIFFFSSILRDRGYFSEFEQLIASNSKHFNATWK